MAGVICSVCGSENTDDEALCRSCGVLLAEGDSPAAEPPPEESPEPEPASATCPACGASIPDPGNLVCVECLEPLTPQSSRSSVTPTRRAGEALRLMFAGQPVDVSPSKSVLLGRDPDHSPVARLFAAHDNVSRRHASVGVEADGRGWVRDEHSTNGTFVNDKLVPSGHTQPLVHGDQLRIASNVVAQVELRRPS